MRSRRRGWGEVRHRIEVEPPKSLSARVQRVSETLRGSQSDRKGRSAIEVITSLAARVEPWQDDQEIHPAMQRQQWSALNIPLLWAVAEGNRHCNVLLWLVQACHQVESITVAGVPLCWKFESRHSPDVREQECCLYPQHEYISRVSFFLCVCLHACTQQFTDH